MRIMRDNEPATGWSEVSAHLDRDADGVGFEESNRCGLR